MQIKYPLLQRNIVMRFVQVIPEIKLVFYYDHRCKTLHSSIRIRYSDVIHNPDSRGSCYLVARSNPGRPRQFVLIESFIASFVKERSIHA